MTHFRSSLRAREIQEQPDKLFEMIRMGIRVSVGQYLSNLMGMELTHKQGHEKKGPIDLADK